MLDMFRHMHLSFVFKGSHDSLNSRACSHFLLDSESVHRDCTLYNLVPVQSYLQWGVSHQCATRISCSSKTLQGINSSVLALRATGSPSFAILFYLGEYSLCKISDLVLLPSAIILLKNTVSSSRNTLSRPILRLI